MVNGRGRQVLFLLLHLVHRKQYLKLSFGSNWSRACRGVLAAVFIGVAVVSAAVFNIWPVKQFINSSYEAKHVREVVRTHPNSATLFANNQMGTVRKATDSGVQLNLEVHFKSVDMSSVAMAVWVSTANGSMIETLYLSPELAFSDYVQWQGENYKRADILPIWRRRYTLISGLNEDGAIDATTGATDNHKFTLEPYFKNLKDELVINLEVNYMRLTSEESQSTLTQPSVLYTAYIDPTDSTTDRKSVV